MQNWAQAHNFQTSLEIQSRQGALKELPHKGGWENGEKLLKSDKHHNSETQNKQHCGIQ